MRVIAHGGAGGPPDEPEPRRDVLEAAASDGADAPTALEAALETVRALESSPRFNAGVGGSIQADGVVRTDAGLMTDDRAVGAACAMPGVEHAADVARLVLEETPHVMFAGVHAVDLAAAYGVEVETDLVTDRTRERWTGMDPAPPEATDVREQAAWVRRAFGGTDTVGAVATDGEALAACTSTGGRWAAMAGRVGDVPQVGSGFFCTGAGGASATGAGEDITRVTLARRAVDLLETHDPEAAATAAIDGFESVTGSTAGVILADRDGRTGSATNADAMQVAVAGDAD
jgi:isoaspartyl peptidase/L-asparaginase-like protein (Ntn-hydrolase superfamily)